MRAKIALKGTSALHWAGVGGGRRQLHTPCWASKSDGSPIGPPLSLRTLGGRKSAPPARAPSPDSETQTDMRLPLAKDQPHMPRGLADRHRSGVTGQPPTGGPRLPRTGAHAGWETHTNTCPRGAVRPRQTPRARAGSQRRPLQTKGDRHPPGSPAPRFEAPPIPQLRLPVCRDQTPPARSSSLGDNRCRDLPP